MPSARIDDKGRLVFPAEVVSFLKAVGVSKVFITTMDMRSVRVYPVSVWDENVRLAEADIDEPDETEQQMFLAKSLGGEDDIDNAGKVLLPVELRKKLGLDRQAVKLDVQQNGCVSVVIQSVFETRMGAAETAAPETWKKMRKRGFK